MKFTFKLRYFYKNNIAILFIVILSFFLRIGAILIDPFLHPWDERFHALVARNLMTSPFTPILRVNPITENYDKFIWCCNHIWLHKQPLFMWQMALSMKVFGVSEWSMRLPSAIMGTILVLLIYRIAILIKVSKRVALLTALLFACSNFHLQMIAGIQGMDHNDVAHGFYVLASIWALFEFEKSKKWYWVIFIGVFSGAAILNKWLTGLLVYFIWGIVLLCQLINKAEVKKQIIFLLLSLIVCCIVFLPWQLYILYRFHDLAIYEYAFNRRHISEALEGHEGEYLYYINHLNYIIGKFLIFFIPLGVILIVRD
ncbi:MAG: glycosyltransferase family 39 protein [Bacteroidetes bacterium]|nr:glycosyltransferase family 39 protein [Bacteroidota bacterium]